MKKILLATSALVAMSGVAVAGDIPAAPMAEMAVAGFTVTATGEAVIFGFYNNTGAGTYGIGGSYEGTLKASKTLDNGSDVNVEVSFDNGGALTATIGYDSSVGNFAAGYQDRDAHGVEVPGAPGNPEVPDETTFASADLSLYTAFTVAAPVLAGGSAVAITYASPEFGGFQLGLGVDGATGLEVVLAGSVDVSGATIEVGASFSAATAATISTAGVLNVGASVEVSGFTVGASYGYDVLAVVSSIEAGVAYATGPFSVGVSYAADDAVGFGLGVIAGGVGYSEGDIAAAVEGTYDLNASAYTVAAGATYTMGDLLVGAGGSYDGTTIGAHAGVDYALNSNVTLGAGVGYDGTNFGAAAGVKVSF